MDSAPRLSIVIPTHDRAARAERAARALVGEIVASDLAGAVEILVVDDGSAPVCAARLRDFIQRERHAFLRYLALPENRGASAARNAGAAACRGAVVAFLDDDIVPAPDYVRATIAAHARHPEALVINGNLRPLHDDVYSGFWFYHYDAVFNRPGERFYPVPMLASGHVSLKRSLLSLESPLFDTTLTAREDYDLYLRLSRRGIPVFKDDSILALNECRRTLMGLLRQRLWYGRGQEQLVAKHGAAFLAGEQQRLTVPPARRYWHLYLLLRLARRAMQLHQGAPWTSRRSPSSS